MLVRKVAAGGLLLVLAALFGISASPAAAKEKTLRAASYPGMTTYQCRTDAIEIYPGQNLNDFNPSRTCPNAEVVSGPGSADVFDKGSTKRGYITRFKPSMVEIKPNGRLVTPAVYDLHLHHVVWILPGQGPTFAAGEEKTIAKMPPGYGLRVGGDENWTINQMIHNLTASEGRQVYITWMIDWVPDGLATREGIEEVNLRWLDVAGAPQLYPVFDAEKKFDTDGDGEFVFPDDVPSNPAEPGYEEREKISNSRYWRVPNGGATLVFGAGHLHPGGQDVDLQVARDGPDPGSTDGDDPAEIKRLFRSDAKYYEPAGAVSWDVSLKATRRDWRVKVRGGDTVFINVAYDVSEASWYESMGIFPLAWSKADDPMAKDPFVDARAVRQMWKGGGTLTHGRLKENIDKKARANLKLPDPRKLRSKGKVKKSGIGIRSFFYDKGGYSAGRGFPKNLMRPPTVEPGTSVLFTNFDALVDQVQEDQVWHSITSCKAPCNKGSGIGYPLANGPIEFDSGQLGFGQNTSRGVTTGTDTYETPPLTKPGKTYTYFCRIHPFMRGSIRVAGKKKGKNNGKQGNAAGDPAAISSGALPG